MFGHYDDFPQYSYIAPDSAKKHQSFEENMKRLHAEIERFTYAAEIACPVTDRDDCCVIGQSNETSKCNACAFKDTFDDIAGSDVFECRLLFLRRWIGKHPEQHDPTEEGK